MSRSAAVCIGQEFVLELLDRHADGVDGDRQRGDDLAGVVTDRDCERAQPGLEQAVGDDVAVGADPAGVLVVGAGAVGEQDPAERRPVGRQPLTDLDGDGEDSATAASWRRRA